WVRRHPTPSVMLAACLLFAVMLVGASLWLVVQQAHQREAVEVDLKELAGLQASARWPEARAMLDQANARLGGGGPDDLRQRLGRARHDLDVVIELDRIRLSRVTSGNLALYKTKADRDYTKVFGDSGLGKAQDSPDLVAARIQGSPVHV